MVTKEQLEEIIESFVVPEYVYCGKTIGCITSNKVEQLAEELLEFIKAHSKEE